MKGTNTRCQMSLGRRRPYADVKRVGRADLGQTTTISERCPHVEFFFIMKRKNICEISTEPARYMCMLEQRWTLTEWEPHSRISIFRGPARDRWQTKPLNIAGCTYIHWSRWDGRKRPLEVQVSKASAAPINASELRVKKVPKWSTVYQPHKRCMQI